jgi:nitrite reductase/ring-hydroxylating ferredoxin subunit
MSTSSSFIRRLGWGGDAIVGMAALRLVGRVALSALEGGAMERLDDPPFHVLVALVRGEPFAIEDACNHAGASLSEGGRRGDCVICPMHGYVFELTTGRLVEPRGLCGDQRTFVATREGDQVVVWDAGPTVDVIGP